MVANFKLNVWVIHFLHRKQNVSRYQFNDYQRKKMLGDANNYFRPSHIIGSSCVQISIKKKKEKYVS